MPSPLTYALPLTLCAVLALPVIASSKGNTAKPAKAPAKKGVRANLTVLLHRDGRTTTLRITCPDRSGFNTRACQALRNHQLFKHPARDGEAVCTLILSESSAEVFGTINRREINEIVQTNACDSRWDTVKVLWEEFDTAFPLPA